MTTLLMSSRHTEDDQALWRAATEFTETVLAAPKMGTPRAVALDVGQIVGRGWAVVEANGAWGSGIYGCEPDVALDVIRHATVQPKAEVAL